MAEETESPGTPDSNGAYVLAFVANALPILGIVATTAILYRSRDILLPIAIAFVLAVILMPISRVLEFYTGRFVSAAIVVIFACGLVTAIGYFLTVELTTVADDVASYSDNIGNKLEALQARVSPPWLEHLESAVSDIQRRVQKNHPSTRSPRIVQTIPVPSVIEQFRPMLPVLDGIVEGLLIAVLLFFLLYSKRHLRDRLVRLVGRSGIILAPQAIETAAKTVGHYLLLFALTNLGFGLACGSIAWFFGLPNALLWGSIAFLLRFIPYVGTVAAGVLPSLVAFALFPGWAKSLGVIASFVLLDQIVAQLVEPFVVGKGIDVSPVALLMSAMYWSWLWGIPGLLLATPVTACLKVAGDYTPALGFFSVLLSADRKLNNYYDIYRLLLDQDLASARQLVIHFCDQRGLERTFDEVFTPLLSLAGAERNSNQITDEAHDALLQTVRELIQDLGNRCGRFRTIDSPRVVGLCPPGEVHSLGLAMVIESLRRVGAVARAIEDNDSIEDLRRQIRKSVPNIVCVSLMMHECLPAAMELVATLKRDMPNLVIIAGGQGTQHNASKMSQVGCDEICGSRQDAERVVRQFVARSARSRLTIQRSLLKA